MLSNKGLYSVCIMFAVAALAPHRAAADCQPREQLDINPGTSIFCSGVDADGLLTPLTDIQLDPEGFEFPTDIPVLGLTITVGAGAVVNDDIAGQAIGVVNGGHTIVNNGTVQASVFGIAGGGGIGSGTTVTNNGLISVVGTGGEGIGFLTPATRVFNTATGVIDVVGADSEGIGLRVDDGRVVNEGRIQTNGDDSEGVAVEGANAEIINSGTIEVIGVESEGIGLEGNGGTITNSGLVAATGFRSEAIGLLGKGEINILEGGGAGTEGNQSVAVGALGNGNTISSAGAISVQGTRAVGVGLIGNDTELGLAPVSVIEASGTSAVAVALSGGGSLGPSGLTLSRGTGTEVTVTGSVAMRLSGEGATGYLLNHDGAKFTGLGAISSESDSVIGLYFAGNGLEANLSGTLELSGADSIGISLGNPNALVGSATSANGTISLEGSYALLGDTSVAVDARGNGHRITNNGSIDTDETGLSLRMVGNDARFTNAAAGRISSGGMVFNGTDLTLVNEGFQEGGGALFDAGSGTVDATNTGTMELGVPADFGVDELAAYTFAEGGGQVRNEGDIRGDEGTIGVLLREVSEALTIDNSGSLETEVGIVGVGGEELIVDNSGTITGRGGIGIAGGTVASVSNSNTISINAPASFSREELSDALGVRLAVEDQAVFNNSGDLTVSTAGTGSTSAVVLGDAAGSGASNRATLANTGTISATSAGSISAARLYGAEVVATNERFASLSATSGGAGAFWALALDAVNTATARNDGNLNAQGTNGRAIGVELESPDAVFDVINSGRIDVRGTDSIGMQVAAGATLTRLSDIVPTTRVFANEDTLVVDGENSRGMVLAAGVNSVRLENAGRFDVAGDGARGIDVEGGSGNFVLNANGFRIAGDNAVGIRINGDGNTIMNGQDSAVFPNAGSDLVTPLGRYVGDAGLLSEVAVVDAFIDLADSLLGNIPVLGDLVVEGANAIGIDISGDQNRVANLPAQGRRGGLPPLGEGTPIFASGDNSIGVRISGDGNIFLNEGTVTGQAYSVLDGAGSNTVINGAYAIGDIDLGGGDDTLVVRQGAELTGIAQGGPGSDELIAAMRNPAFGDPVLVGSLFGNQYQGFETFQKVGDNPLILEGRLDVDTARIRREGMIMAPGSEITGHTIVSSGALITGSGRFGSLTVLAGGFAEVGTSPGTFEIAEDLSVLGGVLELEIGPSPAESDLITVGGVALFDGGLLRLLFTEAALPRPDDLFDVLLAESLLGLETLSFEVLGLSAGLSLVPDFSTPGRLSFLTIPASSAVPEPPAAVLLLLGMLALSLHRRRWRS